MVRVVELRRARAGGVHADGGVGACALHHGVADGAVGSPGSESGLVVHRVDLPAAGCSQQSELRVEINILREHVPGNRCPCWG